MHLQNYILHTYQSQYRFAYQYVKDPLSCTGHPAGSFTLLVLKNLDTLKNPRLFVSWLQPDHIPDLF